MMKSFFKKLAFVMALAMVVSAMAPAATAKAAEAKTVDICVQNDNYIARPTYELTEGDATAVDFCFAGAPDWKNYKWTWDSSDKEVATVDNAGLVTFGTKTGETVITVKGGDVYTGTMKLTVKAKEVVPAYVVKQTAGDKLTITWADAKEATDKVEVYKVYNLTTGSKEVKWPSETTVKDGVATTTVKYGGLEDGCDYVVKFGTVEKTITARVGKVVDIKVTPVASEWDAANSKWVDAKGLYVSENDEYPIRFVVTYITDNDIELTTAPEDTYVNFEVLEGGDDIYLDSTGVESYIYEKGAWAHVVATYCYIENETDKEIPCDFWIEGVEKEEAKLAGVTKYALVAAKNDLPDVAKKDVAWNDTDIIVDDREYIALEVADTLGGVTYLGVTDANYAGVYGNISYLSANDGIALVGEDGLVTPVSTGTTSVIVQLTYDDANGNPVVKNIYAFDITVKASRAVKSVSANNVTVLTDAKFVDSKADVEISAIDNYDKAWTGFTAKVETTSEVADAIKSFEVKDADDGKADGKIKFTVDGSKFPANVNSVTYKVTVGNKTTTFRVTLKNAAYVSGYVAEMGNITVDGSKTGVINGEVKVYSFWRNNGVVYKLENVTDDVIISNGSEDFWNKNTEDLKGALVVTVKNPADPKYTAYASGSAIVVPGVAEVSTTGGKLKVTAGDYTVVVNTVKNTSYDETTNTYKVTRKSTEDEKSFNVKNAAIQLANPVVKDATLYEGNSIEEVIAGYVTFTLGDNKEFTVTAADVIEVDRIANAEAGKIYVKTIKVKVPVVYDGEELDCYFEQTLTINKLLPCEADVF